MPMCWHITHVERSPSSGRGITRLAVRKVFNQASASGRKHYYTLAHPELIGAALHNNAGAFVTRSAVIQRVLLLRQDSIKDAQVAAADGEPLELYQHLAVFDLRHWNVVKLQLLGTDNTSCLH